MIVKPVIVTAFIDIGRSYWQGTANGRPIPPYIKRSTETYLERFERMASRIDNEIIVYSTSDHEDFINGFSNATFMNISPPYSLMCNKYISTIKQIQTDKRFLSMLNCPELPEYWNADYVLLNFLKSYFVYRSHFDTNKFKEVRAWIDFGYARSDDLVPEGEWLFEYDDKINIWKNSDKRDNFKVSHIQLVRSGAVGVRGCHIVSNFDGWVKLWKYMQESFGILTGDGLIDDDQTMLLMSYKNHKSDFTLNIGDEENWFDIFLQKGSKVD